MRQLSLKILTITILSCLIFFNVINANALSIHCTDAKKEINLLACEWPAGVQVQGDNSITYCGGDFVEVEAFGFSLNGGIPADYDVSEKYTFFYGGDVEHLSQRKVRIKLNSALSENVLKVRYGLTVEGTTCYDTAQISFEVYNCIYPAELICNQYKADTLYDKDIVRVVAFGNSANGGIPPVLDVSDEYTFTWDGNIEYLSEREVKLKLDSDKDNILKIRYDLTVEGNTRSATKEIQFDVLPRVFHSELTIYPNPGNGILYIDDKNFQDHVTELKFEIRSMTGQIQTIKESIYLKGFTSLDLTHLPSGLYNIRIIMPDSTVETMLFSKN